MRIALVYLNASNFGDLIIHDAVKYLLEKLSREQQLTTECIDVPIDSYHQNSAGPKSRKSRLLLPLKRLNGAYKNLLHTRGLYRLCPGGVENSFRTQWRMTPAARVYYARERERLREADLILFCGGGMIKYKRQNCHYYLDDITAWADENHVPVVMNAVGVEGYEAEDAECMLLKKALNRECVRFISTRDDLALLKDRYITRADIRLRASCDPALWAGETYGITWTGQKSGLIGLNVVRPKIFAEYMYSVDEKTLLALYRDLILLLRKEGYRVELFSNGLAEDMAFAETLMNTVPELKRQEGVSSFCPADQRELVERIAGYERFLAVRLHAAIVGTALGIPNVSLVWNRKQLLFGKQIAREDQFLLQESFTAGTVCRKLSSAEAGAVDEAYKMTVYNNLREALGICGMPSGGVV